MLMRSPKRAGGRAGGRTRTRFDQYLSGVQMEHSQGRRTRRPPSPAPRSATPKFVIGGFVFPFPSDWSGVTISNPVQSDNCILLRRLQQGQSAPLIHQGPSHVYSEVSSSSASARTTSLAGVPYLPPSLVVLYINDCKSLSSLPNGPQAYSSLQRLVITECPSLKRLPTCLQQRLSSIPDKDLDARFQDPSLFNPQSWRNAIRRA